MNRQDRADAVDREVGARLLPDAVVQALRHWWKENAPTYSDGTPGAHAVRYTPRRWVQIVPWPPALTLPCAGGDAAISRAEVTGAVADALRREAFREALVATYVWGKGKRGTPGGSGPATLHKILAAGGLDAALATAVTALREHGSREAYAALHRQVPGFGPSFFTKFLYFTGTTLPPAQGPAPLSLDRVLARRLRWLAAAVGRESGHDPDGSVASWVWADGNWSPHRYGVYLSFLHAAARQLAASDDWPSDAEPGRESRPPPRCQHGRTPVARGPAATEPLGSRAFCHGLAGLAYLREPWRTPHLYLRIRPCGVGLAVGPASTRRIRTGRPGAPPRSRPERRSCCGSAWPAASRTLAARREGSPAPCGEGYGAGRTAAGPVPASRGKTWFSG
ncbi:hypothetical protein M2163_009174 [Streptomyces sp. SAI-135]|uniref:8-oxoguanine DNA glycosylase OGG fold protein n=1 Tax=unclassified Streptomyces TaxID=2593676 RepID=UPI002474FD83|nr:MULTISPECIES: hypothetical protein [unclassified Streptomyces]MDH6513852.1 hypothetical protein [Streptomyces sp. SAI-090]MDH6546029.1 hypothetical protein [Streptomyces sp. SAI-041]MDH6565112.1 hypothetical protein [Streptomyces sp. SAI-117]MDH6622066.1 hypothetical protein [Streptomyces sp. SAI-135]